MLTCCSCSAQNEPHSSPAPLHHAVLQVEQVMEVPGGLMPAMKVEGLQQPLSLTLRQHQEVLQLKVG